VEAKRVLEAYGIPVVPTVFVRNGDDVLDAAAGLGYPVALKIVAPEILHKSDVGGVALDLHSGDALRSAAVGMRQRVARTAPQAHVRGFAVEAMVHRPHARELIVGIAQDPVFGPVVLFGDGGTAVEIRRDRAVALLPLNDTLVRDLVARTRVGALLAGYRGEAGVDQPALADALLRVSQLACDVPELAELDINPLLADAQGVLALDARIRVRPLAAGEGSRLALRPYPRELQEGWLVAGHKLQVRPIRPDDGARLAQFYAEASERDLRLRFFLARREVPRSELARYCLIDYEREMSFVALDGDRLAGEVRAMCDPDNERAEFAIQVARDWQRRGLGASLLRKLLDYLRARGTREVTGQCLRENEGMAALARHAGFEVRTGQDDTFDFRLALHA
jgi:acetyltransferase